MPRKFHKTIFQIEILSEDPYPEGKSLVDIAYDIREGECSGRVHRVSSEELDGPAMANALIEQDSDPEFFRLDQDGRDLDGDDEGGHGPVTAAVTDYLANFSVDDQKTEEPPPLSGDQKGKPRHSSSLGGPGR